MKKFILLFILSSLTPTTHLLSYKPFAKEKISEIINSENREVFSLTKGWQKSYDKKNWMDAMVPSTETTKNTVVYKKDIKINKNFTDNKNLNFFFPGVSGQVEFYFNDEFIIKYDGAFLPVFLSIPKSLILQGNNELKLVFLENSRLENLLSIARFNAPEISKGIIREPFQVITSEIWVSDLTYDIKSIPGGATVIEAAVTCSAGEISNTISADSATTTTNNNNNSSVGTKKTKIDIEFKLINKNTGVLEASSIENKSVFLEDSRSKILNFQINASNLKWWSVEHPELYKLQIQLRVNGVVVDDYFINIGLKTLTKKNNSFLLNGVPMEIKAITYHEYFTSTKSTLSAYRIEEDIKSIKILGANAIRFSNPPSPYIANLCDKYGLLMLIDMPLYNLPQKLLSNEEVFVKSQNILSRMLAYYSKNSSLFAVGIGDNLMESQELVDFTNKLLNTSKKNKIFKYKFFNIETNKFDISGLDFVCPTLVGRNLSYEKIKEKIDTIKNNTKIPILFMFGYCVQPDNFNGYSDPTSIEHQAYFIQNCYNISKKTHLAGSIIDSYNDYTTEYPVLVLNYYNKYINSTGIVDGYRNSRLSYSVVKSLFNNEKLPLLNAGSYYNESPISYIIFELLVIFVILLMLHRYKRFREYFLRATIRHYNFYADIRDNRILSIHQTIIFGFLIAISIAMSISSILISLRYNLDYSYLFIVIMPYTNVLDVIFNSAWQPELLVILLTFLISIKFIIVAIVIKLLAVLFSARIYINKAITTVIWTALPFIFLIPLSILLTKLVHVSGFFVGIFIILFIIAAIMFVFRLSKALSVIFDKPILKIYLYGIAALIVLILVPMFFYENTNDFLPFIKYFCYLP